MVIANEKYNKVSKPILDLVKEDDILSAMESFLSVYKQERMNGKPKIPLSIFSDKKLGILEATVKYMKESQSMRYSQIARLLNRNERTVWVSFHKAIKKKQSRFQEENSDFAIPCEIFSNRKLGPLETLVIYLKDNLNFSFHEISRRINRKYMTVYLSYNNGKNKNA